MMITNQLLKYFLFRTVVLAAVWLFLSACDRDWSNPTDSNTEAEANAWSPVKLTATALNDQQVQLRWEGSETRIDGYRVYRSAGNEKFQIIADKVKTKAYLDTALLVTQSYTYKISALAGTNESSPTDTVQIQTIFPAPTNLSAQALDDQRIKLTWTDNCSFETGYQIERNSGNGFQQIAHLGSNATLYTDSGLNYGTSYQYRVRAYTSQNVSEYATLNSATTIIPAPTNLTAEVINYHSLKLTWVDNCNFESGYRLERNGGAGFQQIAELGANITQYLDSGLNFGTTYQYRVRAYTAYNTSAYSNEAEWLCSVTDIDGNVYAIVKIGNQIWMAENLKVTKYLDGTAIPNVTDNTSWAGLSTGAYCYYNNESSNGDSYGALYNWYAVNDARGLAPEGWHVPTDAEWSELENYLGGESVAGKKLKMNSSLWNTNTGTDDAGFGALPGGYRALYSGDFRSMGTNAYFWSSSSSIVQGVWYRLLYGDTDDFYRSIYNFQRNGYSVRCVMDVE
jgi:uncharacterized protein (TIGR02145 family)